MGRVWIPAALAVLWAGAVSPASAGLESQAPAEAAIASDGVFEERRAEARAALIVALEGLADWCNDHKLFVERNTVFEQILTFDPEHFRAHKGLGHSRLRDGTWVVEEGGKEPRNYDRKALERLPAERAERLKPFRDEMMALAAAHAEELGSAGVFDVYAEILSVVPDDVEIRKLRGERLVDDAWVLDETSIAKERRAEIKQAVRESLRAVERPELILPDELEKSLRVAWRNSLRTPRVRVLSTGDRDGALRVLQATDAVAGLFTAAFGVEAKHPEGYTVYLLTHEGEERGFLEAHPAIDEETRAFYLTLAGAGIPNSSSSARWDDDAAARLDGATRHTVSQLLYSTFGLGLSHGWAYEGLGLYLTRELVGTRLTWYVQPGADPDEYEKNQRAKLLSSDTNWMNEAWELLQSERRPDLERVLTRNVNEMTVDDLLYSYALAAYLIEGRPGEVGAFLKLVGASDDPVRAVNAALGMELPQLAERVERWLGERR